MRLKRGLNRILLSLIRSQVTSTAPSQNYDLFNLAKPENNVTFKQIFIPKHLWITYFLSKKSYFLKVAPYCQDELLAHLIFFNKLLFILKFTFFTCD